MPAARRRDRNRRGTPRRALHPTTSRLSPRHPEGPSEFVVDVVTEKRTLSNESAGESKAPHALAAKHSLNFEYRMTVVLCFLLLLIFTQYGYVLHVCFAANVNLPLSHTTPSCFSAHRAIRHSATGRPDLLHLRSIRNPSPFFVLMLQCVQPGKRVGRINVQPGKRVGRIAPAPARPVFATRTYVQVHAMRRNVLCMRCNQFGMCRYQHVASMHASMCRLHVPTGAAHACYRIRHNF